MADTKNCARRLFPLKTIGDVTELFRAQLRPDRKPNLTLLSIVSGLIESALTTCTDGKESPSLSYDSVSSHSSPMAINIPHITFQSVDALQNKFATQIKGQTYFLTLLSSCHHLNVWHCRICIKLIVVLMTFLLSNCFFLSASWFIWMSFSAKLIVVHFVNFLKADCFLWLFFIFVFYHYFCFVFVFFLSVKWIYFECQLDFLQELICLLLL